MSKIINLSSKKYPGHVCIIDDEDFELLNQYTWYPDVPLFKNTIYAKGWVKTKYVKMHRFIMESHNHNIDKQDIDHEDHNGLNNQKENLRICTPKQNSYNSIIPKSSITSSYKGVDFVKRNNKFRVRISGMHIGYFDNEIDAALAYNNKAIELYKEFAYLNVIKENINE
jgi:hypothetical protein